MINKEKVSQALHWLKKNNTLYKDVFLSMNDICNKTLDFRCENPLSHYKLSEKDQPHIMLDIKETIPTQAHPKIRTSEGCNSDTHESHIHVNKKMKMEDAQPLMEYTNNTLSEVKQCTSPTKDQTCKSEDEDNNVQHLSMIPTDYIIPSSHKKDKQEHVPTFTVPYFEVQPINIFQHKTAEELAFPHLFPYGINGMKSLTNTVTPHQ